MRLLHFWGLFIIVGIFAGLAIVSRKDVQQCVADGILAELEADWDAKVTVDDSSVDFLTGTLGFRGCTIRPRTMPGCVCKVGSGTILVDRFSLAVLKKKHLKIFIQDVKVETGFTKSGKCEFFELLKLIMAPSDSVFLRHFSLNNAFFKFRTGVGANDFKLGGGIKIDCGRSGRFKLSSDVKNSAWAISGVTVLKNFFVRGNVARRKRQNKFLGNFNGACDLPGLGKDAHHRINLAFRNGRCAGSLLPQDSGVHVNYRSDQRSKCTRWYTDEGALTSFAKLLKRAGASLPIKIAESLVARGAVGGVGNRESLVARLAVIDNKKSRNFLSSCGEIGKNGIRFAWTLCPTRHTKLTGTIELPKDSQPKGTVALGLPVPLVSGLSCVPGKSTMASFEKLGSGAWLGKYCLGTSGYRAPRCNKCVGCFRTKPHGNSEIYCVLPHGNFRCDISSFSPLKISSLTESHHGRREMCLVDKKVESTVSGELEFDFVRRFLPWPEGECIVGRGGKIDLTVDYKDKNKLTGELNLNDAIITIPGVENSVRSASFEFVCDFREKILSVHDVEVGCARGSFTSPRMNYRWQDQELDAPLEMHGLHVNYGQSLASVFDGTMRVSKHGGKFDVYGNLISSNGHITQEFFSSDLFYRIKNSRGGLKFVREINSNVSVNIATRDPVEVTTKFFEAPVHVRTIFKALFEKGTLKNPLVLGSFNFDGGKFHLLKNTFSVERGKVDMGPDTMRDPFIDLVAHTNVKRSVVTAHVHGSIRDPFVSLESTPDVDEAHIIGLLLGGTEHDFSSNLTGILMRNAHGFLTQRHGKKPSRWSKLSTISKPLEYIQFSPPVIEHTGKRGLMATVQVDLTPQVQASMKKDLFSQDNPALQIEYALSDELGLRLSRESQGDVGAEAEVAFRF